MKVKEVCNVWELGGNAARFPDLIETPILACHGLAKMAVFLVLDLSNPAALWPTLDSCLRHLRKGVTTALSAHPDLTKALDEALARRLGEADYADRGFRFPGVPEGAEGQAEAETYMLNETKSVPMKMKIPNLIIPVTDLTEKS